jgi:hypothetical protein
MIIAFARFLHPLSEVAVNQHFSDRLHIALSTSARTVGAVVGVSSG